VNLDKLTVIIQRMLSKQEQYHYDGITEPRRPDPASPSAACELPDRATIVAVYLPQATNVSKEDKVPVPLLCSEEG
jgi:hypothetical protein